MRLFNIRIGTTWQPVQEVFWYDGSAWQRVEELYHYHGAAWNKCYDYAFEYNLTFGVSTSGNYNIRDLAIAAGWDGLIPLRATVTVNTGVTVYSPTVSAATIIFNGVWPAGSTAVLINNGNIYGCGGRGGDGAGGHNIQYYNDAWGYVVVTYNVPYSAGNEGQTGGPAVYVKDINLVITNNGTIAGGGGGGSGGVGSSEHSLNNLGAFCWQTPGAGGGGGGRPFGAGGAGGFRGETNGVPYANGTPGSAGTLSAPGAGGPGNDVFAWNGNNFFNTGRTLNGGGDGGNGGDLGQPGQFMTQMRRDLTSYGYPSYAALANDYGYPVGRSAGSPGFSVQGINWVTFVTAGTRLGWITST